MSRPIEHESDAAAVMHAALGKDDASISDMLERIAKLLDAFGCVLWGVVPGSVLTSKPPKGKLYVMAAWFPTPGEIFALHDLPLDCVSGQVLLTRQPKRGVDGKDGLKIYRHAFLQRHNVNTYCGVPLNFSGDEWGVLSVYRCADQFEFTMEDQERVKALSSIVPCLCQAVRHRLSFQLLQKIEVILQDAERESERAPLDKKAKRDVLKLICTNIGLAFNCLEVSVFLEDRLERTKVYELQATTRQDWIRKTDYTADLKEGLTGWPLATRESIHLFDLLEFDPTADDVQDQYPCLTWKNPLKVENLPPREFGAKTKADQPPLTFMAAPCLLGTELLGAIRCCTATRGPYYFSVHEVLLLQLVAAQISQCWLTWINRRVVQQENESWNKLVREMGKLNDFVQSELQTQAPDRAQILEKIVEMTQHALPVADICGVRLLAEDGSKNLEYATNPKGHWPEHTRRQIAADLSARRFNVDEMPPKSAGVEAFQTKKVVVRSDVGADPNYHAIFPGVKWMLVAPIKVGNDVFGVLDARGTGGVNFPSNAKAIMELIGSQVGLFLHLAKTVVCLRSAEATANKRLADLREIQEAQLQALQDLAHQLKTPLNQALSRVSAAVYTLTGEPRLELVRIRGLCSKVNRVTQSLRLLEELAKGQPLNVRKSALEHGQLMKMLVEAAQDNELTVDPRRKIRFSVERNTFVDIWNSRVSVDPLLFEQALNNLLDNAAKYSFDNTEVEIYGGTSPVKNIFIAVVNRGLAIRLADISRFTQRSIRGPQAILVTQEGSGIGLWIVDNIMKAHGGELIIFPTKPDGRTEIRIVFPLNT